MRIMLLIAGVLSVLAAGCGVAPAPDAARPFSRVITFGDSLSDVGNLHLETLIAPQPPYAFGRFSNGPLWIEHLAEHFGLEVMPSYFGGDDYAQAGAESGDGFFDAAVVQVAPNVLKQIELYQERPDGTELFVIWAGANDIFDADTNDPAGLGQQIADNLSAAVQKLYARGGRSFLVANLPDVGMTPKYLGKKRAAFGTSACAAVNADLAIELTVLDSLPDITIYRLDVATLFEELLATPPAGISNTTERAWSGSILGYFAGGALVSDPDAYVFWDGVHPTRVMHAMLGDMAIQQVENQLMVKTAMSGGTGAAVVLPGAVEFWLGYLRQLAGV